MKLRVMIFLLSFVMGLSMNCYSQVYTPADPEYYSMERQQIRFDDSQILLFNYRGFACPRQYSMTGFTNVQFMPVNAPRYSFFMNIMDNRTGKIIQDDVPQTWDKRIYEGKGYDPLAANFRPNSPFVVVTQDEKWQPNSYSRSGTFHKEVGGKWISFSMKTVTSVSSCNDEVFLKITFRNRKDEPINLTLIPQQVAKELEYDGMSGTDTTKQIDAFTLASEQMRVTVSSNIKTITDKGFELNLQPGKTVTVCFAIQFNSSDKKTPAVFQKDIPIRIQQAQLTTREKLKWAYNTFPQLESTNKKFEEYYYRALLSVLMCRYENPNFITNPFWAVGTWQFTISWDNSYSSDVLAMLDAKSLKEAILTDLREVKMKKTYVSWKGAYWDNIYIQEPFALQIMIDAYLRHTGDYTIFSEKAGDATIWQWMKRWITELQTNYTNKDGLIDIGYDTQKIIEIRTDGYNHVVPVLNILTTNLLHRMSEWGKLINDSESNGYFNDAEKLKDLTNKNLWNEQEGWFDNLYPDGKKGTIRTMHLYDALGTKYLSGEQINKLVSHLKEGVFLGKYGVYSIARNDTVHWDLIDSDWGGGGQYAGMPGRISRYLFQNGFAEVGWDVLKRNMRYIDYFPYFPQNPKTDNPEQDRSSMPLEISSGAGIEAIIFGVFGISIDGNQLIIKPNTCEDLGETSLNNFNFRGKLYKIQMHKRSFDVYQDGNLFASEPYGESVVVAYANQ
jgi:hypothetical protein